MRLLRRAAYLLRERASVALFGSLLWWLVEHLFDKAIESAVRAFIPYL